MVTTVGVYRVSATVSLNGNAIHLQSDIKQNASGEYATRITLSDGVREHSVIANRNEIANLSDELMAFIRECNQCSA